MPVGTRPRVHRPGEGSAPARCRRSLTCLVCALLLVAAGLARAQLSSEIDLAGNWSTDNATSEDMDPPDDPLPGNWYGIPLNAAGRARALTYSPLELSEPPLLCDYAPSYLMIGPFGLRIWNDTDPDNGTTIAWHIGGWEDLAPITIWMDGRPTPSKYAAHPKSGFASGVWDHGILKASVTHMQAGIAKRNGAPLSDRATMTLWFMRYGNQLTLFAHITDPVYLSEPYTLTRTFVSYLGRPHRTVGFPCVPTYEGVAEDQVPFYLPARNPTLQVAQQAYGIPLRASLDGAKTMYPAYRKELQALYQRPASCERQRKYQAGEPCGGPGKLPRRGPGTGRLQAP